MEDRGRGNPELLLWKRMVLSLGGRGAHGAQPSEEECGDQITQGCNLVTANLPGDPGAASCLLTCHGGHGRFMQKKSCKCDASSPHCPGQRAGGVFASHLGGQAVRCPRDTGDPRVVRQDMAPAPHASLGQET